jgi:hypothetical protein
LELLPPPTNKHGNDVVFYRENVEEEEETTKVVTPVAQKHKTIEACFIRYAAPVCL